jgi:histidyl-tRNA synthetase
VVREPHQPVSVVREGIARRRLRVELYPDAPVEDGKKVGDKQFKYASARGIPFVAVIGGDELANGTVAIKNMKTGEQKSVPRSEAVKWLSN